MKLICVKLYRNLNDCTVHMENRGQCDTHILTTVSGKLPLNHVIPTTDTTQELVNRLGKGHVGYIFMAMYTYCEDTWGLTPVQPLWFCQQTPEPYHILILHSVKDYENLLSDPCCARWIILLARMDIFIYHDT